MKAKKELILWIVVPLIAYLVFATVIVWPLLLYDAEKRGQTVSPSAVLPSAFFAIFVFAGYGGILGIAFLTILAASWLIGFSRSYEKYLQEKASMHAQRM